MPPNIEAMLRSAIDAVKANRKAEARLMLERIVQVDQMNEQAWLWLSACVETAEEQAICLENVLDINPNNQKALKGLQALQTRLAPADDPFAASPFGSPSEADDPFAGSPFGGAPQPPSRPSSTPTSVDWGAGSTSVPAHGSGGSVPAFSDEDYDAWLENLPLGTSNSVFSAAPVDSPFSVPTDPLEDLDNFDYGGLWAGDQRSAPAPSVDAEPFSFRGDYASTGYADDALFSDGEESTYGSTAAEGVFDQAFADDELIEDSQPDYSLYSPESTDAADFGAEEFDDSPLTLEDIQGYAESTPASPARPRNVPQSLIGGKGRSTFSGSGRGKYGTSDPFSRIPADIEAVGAASGSPFSAGVLALAGLNVIALIFLVINLLG
jgi:hypothetical protein